MACGRAVVPVPGLAVVTGRVGATHTWLLWCQAQLRRSISKCVFDGVEGGGPDVLHELIWLQLQDCLLSARKLKR